MRLAALAVAAVVASSCAPSNYYFHFDLTDPGAKNMTKPGERDTLETPEVIAEVVADPADFQAVLLVLTNRTSQQLQVQWGQIMLIGPDRVARNIHPDEAVGPIEPYTKQRVRLIPFELPTVGNAAAGYDEQMFELDVPMVAMGKSQHLRLHLKAHAVKL